MVPRKDQTDSKENMWPDTINLNSNKQQKIERNQSILKVFVRIRFDSPIKRMNEDTFDLINNQIIYKKPTKT